jgi:hypothetical protein
MGLDARVGPSQAPGSPLALGPTRAEAGRGPPIPMLTHETEAVTLLESPGVPHLPIKRIQSPRRSGLNPA